MSFCACLQISFNWRKQQWVQSMNGKVTPCPLVRFPNCIVQSTKVEVGDPDYLPSSNLSLSNLLILWSQNVNCDKTKHLPHQSCSFFHQRGKGRGQATNRVTMATLWLWSLLPGERHRSGCPPPTPAPATPTVAASPHWPHILGPGTQISQYCHLIPSLVQLWRAAPLVGLCCQLIVSKTEAHDDARCHGTEALWRHSIVHVTRLQSPTIDCWAFQNISMRDALRVFPLKQSSFEIKMIFEWRYFANDCVLQKQWCRCIPFPFLLFLKH